MKVEPPSSSRCRTFSRTWFDRFSALSSIVIYCYADRSTLLSCKHRWINRITTSQTFPRRSFRGTSRSSWTATAAGRCSAGWSACAGISRAPRPFATIVTECARLRKEHGGPDFLTLYSFSLENWKRPVDEVSFLMQMYIEYLRQERATMMENNIRFRQIGRLENLPEPVLDEVDVTLEETKNNDGLTLVLALNYGSRAEITDARARDRARMCSQAS